MNSKFEIVYNSDLIIRDPGEAATLCLFYDRVYLPFTDPRTLGHVVNATIADDTHSIGTTYHDPYDIRDWEFKNQTLFQAKVITRLPAPQKRPEPEKPYDSQRNYDSTLKDIYDMSAFTNRNEWRLGGGWGIPAEELAEGDEIVRTHSEKIFRQRTEEEISRILAEQPIDTSLEEYEVIDLPDHSLTEKNKKPRTKMNKKRLKQERKKLEDERKRQERRTLREQAQREKQRLAIEALKFEEAQVNVLEVRRWFRKPTPLSSRPGTITLQVDPSSIPALRLEGTDNQRYVRANLIEHQLRDDITLPQIYSNLDQRKFARDMMVALEAKATFSYLLPRIRVLNVEEILELRRRLADTREGFAMHLQKLSKGLEEHAKEGTPIEEVSRFATNLIETELIPDYREFQRQLEGIKAHGWKTFLDPLSKIAEINAAPWTPQFWALLLKSIGVSILDTTTEQKEKLTNRYQAYKFMGQVEAASARHGRI